MGYIWAISSGKSVIEDWLLIFILWGIRESNSDLTQFGASFSLLNNILNR